MWVEVVLKLEIILLVKQTPRTLHIVTEISKAQSPPLCTIPYEGCSK